MVVGNKYSDKKQTKGKLKKKWLLPTMLSLGITCLIVSIVFMYIDPILLVVGYRLRLDNGTLLHKLILTELKGPKLYLYLFNITNAEQFQSGIDQKLKLKEIGPFVYQEYRSTDGLEINRKPGIMSYIPKIRLEFIEKESYGRLEDVYLTLPNLPTLSATALISKYPYFVKQIFNVVAAGVKAKPFKNISVQDFFWGYPDPLINVANTAVPGLIYFKSIGLLERYYDLDADYHLELGTSNSEKFRVKDVKRIKLQDGIPRDFADKSLFSHHSYEGAIFPSSMTPDMDIHIYRHSICRPFQLQHVGFRNMQYGGEAFLYNIHNMAFNDHQLCDSKGWCPSGLKNLSPCYFGIPFALSKGHFLDSDPRILDQVEGLNPDKKIHNSEVCIDPKIGVTVSGYASFQINFFMADDVAFNSEMKNFKHTTVIPLLHIVVNQPEMLKQVKDVLRLIYKQGPVIILASQIVCIISSLILLLYSARLIQIKLAKTRIALDTKIKKEKVTL